MPPTQITPVRKQPPPPIVPLPELNADEGDGGNAKIHGRFRETDVPSTPERSASSSPPLAESVVSGVSGTAKSESRFTVIPASPDSPSPRLSQVPADVRGETEELLETPIVQV